MDDKVSVGVYGTLKEGFPAHYLLGDDAVRLNDRTICGFRLLVSRYVTFPAIVPSEGSCVTVEVYEVPSVRLRELDHYEGVPGLYTREEVDGVHVYVLPQVLAENMGFNIEVDSFVVPPDRIDPMELIRGGR